MTAKHTPEIEQLRDKILKERDAGNIVFGGLPGDLMTASLDDFIKQPADGILYDLNRLEEISLTFLGDPKWVNDFAVALTIRKIMAENERLRAVNAELVSELTNIVNIDMTLMREDWREDADRQFRLWAQNRARAALENAKAKG